jgi:invasion protein IalB
MISRLSCALLLTAVALAPRFADAAPQVLGNFQSWAAYTTQAGESKVCYALSRPTASEPKKVHRDPAFFLLNDWPGRKAKGEPEIVPGYQYKDGSDVTVEIGTNKFIFFTKNDGGAGGAWVEAQADEQRLVDAMKTGSEAVVTGTSKRGTVTRDTYSLAGFGDALEKAHAACTL